MVIKNLKNDHPEVYKAALRNQILQGNKENENHSLSTGKNGGNFDWDISIEGSSIWLSIYQGNFKPFYDNLKKSTSLWI